MLKTTFKHETGFKIQNRDRIISLKSIFELWVKARDVLSRFQTAPLPRGICFQNLAANNSKKRKIKKNYIWRGHLMYKFSTRNVIRNLKHTCRSKSKQRANSIYYFILSCLVYILTIIILIRFLLTFRDRFFKNVFNFQTAESSVTPTNIHMYTLKTRF